MSITAEKWKEKHPRSDCHDCGAKPGEEHNPGCDVERCSVCKGQFIGCGCEGHDSSKVKWTGWWPGELECVNRGWFSRMIPGKMGWHPCKWYDPDATPDMNRWAVFSICGEDRCYDKDRR